MYNHYYKGTNKYQRFKMIVNRINYFKQYYLDIYSECGNYISEYDSTYRSIQGYNIDLQLLVNAWINDYQTEQLGLGPNFTLRVDSEGGFGVSTDNCYRDFMIEAAYRDYILQVIDSNHIINFDTSDLDVTNQIRLKLSNCLRLNIQ